MDNNTNTETILSSATEHHQHTLALIQSATRNIFIHCHDLTPRIYSHPDIASALTQFVIANSAQRYVRIAVSDTNTVVSCDHKILDTCRRLSSNITTHKISKEHEKHTESFILVDNNIFILRRDYSSFDGSLIKNPKQAKELLNLFNEIWSHSQTDSNLNRLYI
ncbi:hypothetical protein MNBD_GAMMA23-546 [hydrothermal vent metagenome]|uniref:DUF7931 domain-containing protein n=1 Tax=hydrothermal vent metagenome TaxID=652676 RepID=A0A3B0ZRH1_9ZZZZ